STIVGADEIIVLEHGAIVERGTHAALLAARGLYASMWSRQREAEEAREILEAVDEEAAAGTEGVPVSDKAAAIESEPPADREIPLADIPAEEGRGHAMSISTSIRSQFAPLHPEGYPFVGGFAIAAVILFWMWSPAGWLAALATLWCAYFFRDPQRVTPIYPGVVVAPADGRVVSVTTAAP